MKQVILCIIVLYSFSSCKKQSAELLAQRWNFVAFDMPKLDRFLYEIGDPNDTKDIIMQKFFLDNKLILRNDSSFDMVLMKQYMHGMWKYYAESKSIELDDLSANKQHISFHMDTVDADILHFDTDEFTIDKLADNLVSSNIEHTYLLHKPYYQFFLEMDKERFTSPSEDLYSKENNWWRIKPAQSETKEQIKKRVLNHLAFWQLLFHDADKNARPYVSYNWFSSPLVVASNGVQLKFYNDVKKDWDSNFYDSIQAHAGYELMRKCFSKKLKYLQTENKYLRNEDIIKQLTQNLLTASKED